MDFGSVDSGIFFGKNRIIWEFFLEGGPNVYVRILTKCDFFVKKKKCSLGLKMQNKPYFFFGRGVPKRGGGGGGGGPTFGKNSQIIPYFFSDAFPKMKFPLFKFYKYYLQVSRECPNSSSSEKFGPSSREY